MAWNRPLMIALLAGLVALAWWRLQPDDGEVRRSRLLMGTVVEIVADGLPADRLDAAVEAAFTEMARLEAQLSSHRADSEVASLSRSATGGELSADTAAVLALGLEVSRSSGGAFDMTLGRLVRLWDIEGEHPAVPDREAIAAALAGVGPEALELRGRKLVKHAADLQLDLGGIAKGYAVDRAAAVLRERGVTSAAINAGGDISLIGRHGERPWRIGIQHPRRQDEVLEAVQAADRAVVTSGDYERFFEQDGRRYHHILDPRSGFPATGCQSVTVIADSVTLADALATALFVLGPQEGLALLGRYPGTAALIVATDGSRHPSAGWDAYRAAP